MYRHGLLRAKRKKAYLRAIAAEHSDLAPRAARNLGSLLEMQEDYEGAAEAYRQAIASGHAEAAPNAAKDLGLLLEKQEDYDGAAEAWRQAMASEQTEVLVEAEAGLRRVEGKD